jgi:hypothetical protein
MQTVILLASSDSTVAIESVKVAGAKQPVSTKIKSLGVIIDSRLSPDSQVNAIARDCNYHVCVTSVALLPSTLPKCWHAASLVPDSITAIHYSTARRTKTLPFYRDSRTRWRAWFYRCHGLCIQFRCCSHCIGCVLGSAFNTSSLS